MCNIDDLMSDLSREQYKGLRSEGSSYNYI